MTSPPLPSSRPPLFPSSRLASAAYYTPAKEVGVGFNVYSYRDRLVGWVASEGTAQDMVKRMNSASPREELASSHREGPSCKG